MPELLKNKFNKTAITRMARHFATSWPAFDQKAFVLKATHNLDALELKERESQIAAAMAANLPKDYEHAADIMLASLAPDDDGDIGGADITDAGIAGWMIMPMTLYTGRHGLGHFDTSMILLRELTKRFSSEYGIRYFLLDQPERTLAVLETWTKNPSRHVRRLVSEGTRPRLPWAMQLPAFIKNPTPILPLLDSLKDDEEEYVRRSVANNLNDIAKDHPDRVAKIAGLWLRGADAGREKLVRHACRTLIKQGHTLTLAALGYGPPRVKLERFEIKTPRVHFGEVLEFEMSLLSDAVKAQNLVIDYIIHHRKANGGTTPKVFKWKTARLDSNAVLLAKRKHPIRKITTRVYYSGKHRIEIVVNGVSQGEGEFELIM